MKNSKIPQGGTEFYDYRNLVPLGSLRQSALPKLAVLPLIQHSGPEYEALVTPGSMVEENQVLARTKKGTPLHSPIPGKIQAIKEVDIPGIGLVKSLIVEMRGSFSWTGKETRIPGKKDPSIKEMKSRIKECGVVFHKGSKTPIHTLLNKAFKKIVLNLVQGQPYQNSDDQIVWNYPVELTQGLQVMMRLFPGVPLVLAFEERAHEANHHFIRKAKGLFSDTIAIPPRYPLGDSRMLYRILENKYLNAGRWPEDEGVLVLSAGCLLDIFQATMENRPVVERVVTISGPGVKKPSVFRVKIGTPVVQLLEDCGGLTDKFTDLIENGLLQGESVSHLGTPVTKTSASYIALASPNETPNHQEECISCGHCAQICPVEIQPFEIYRSLSVKDSEEAFEFGLERCISCGLCQTECPSHLPLLDIFQKELEKGKPSQGEQS